jgi:hypothetical protein
MDTLSDKDNGEFDDYDEPDLSEKNDEMDTLSDKDNDEIFFYKNDFFNFDENFDESSDESSEKTDDEINETNNKNGDEDFSITGIVKSSNFLKINQY